jgi:hypothetical protein
LEVARGCRTLKRMRALGTAVVLVVLATAAPAGAAVANLDADAAKEKVVAVDPAPASTYGRKVVLTDRCGNTNKSYALSRVMDRVTYIRLKDIDGEPDRPEFSFELRNASGRSGVAKVARLGHPGQGGCAKPVTLLAYSSSSPPIAPPRGAKVYDWSLSYVDDIGNQGLEIRLRELYLRKGDKPNKPSLQRVTFFRYAKNTDRYVSYKTQVSPIG